MSPNYNSRFWNSTSARVITETQQEKVQLLKSAFSLNLKSYPEHRVTFPSKDIFINMTLELEAVNVNLTMDDVLKVIYITCQYCEFLAQNFSSIYIHMSVFVVTDVTSQRGGKILH